VNAIAATNEREVWKEHRNALDPFRPQNFFIEQEPNEHGEIVSVATIFLTNHECPWRCIYCDLWKNTLAETVPPGAVPTQIDFALVQLHVDKPRQIKLYNAGSFFDPKAIPPEDFSAIAGRVSQFERVIVECHPALIGNSALRFRDLLEHRASGATLEVAMGLEIADDEILAKLNKRMTLALFARAAKFLREHDVALRAFVIVKPPFVREEDALHFARRSIDFAFDCGAGVVSLIPARFGPAELDALAPRGDFAPPKLAALQAALDYGVTRRRGRVFADLWDLQKLDGPPEQISRLRETNHRQAVSP
jgi:radical SAM enzyme (TIGR01210 family)